MVDLDLIDEGRFYYTPFLHYWDKLQTADLNTRGQFSLSNEQCVSLLKEAKEKGIQEILINTTCNRTEIYAYAEHPYQVIKLLCAHSGGELSVFEQLGYILKNEAAIHHIFRVGTGLDSQILGDFEIIGQLKQGFYRSKKLGLVNGFSERLVNAVIQAVNVLKPKQNLHWSNLCRFCSVQYIIQNIEAVSDKNILLFGTGKIGRNTCENLIKHTENDHIVLINRTHEKAKNIAGKFNVLVKEYGDLPTEIRKADVMIVATGAQLPTVAKDIIHTEKPLLILDLSIPSNVHENVKSLEHVKVVNLDTLSQITNKTLEERRKHLPHAQEILHEIEAEFLQWLHDRQYAPTLRALKAKLTAQQTAEIKARERKQNLPEEATLVSDQMIKKLPGN